MEITSGIFGVVGICVGVVVVKKIVIFEMPKKNMVVYENDMGKTNFHWSSHKSGPIQWNEAGEKQKKLLGHKEWGHQHHSIFGPTIGKIPQIWWKMELSNSLCRYSQPNIIMKKLKN